LRGSAAGQKKERRRQTGSQRIFVCRAMALLITSPSGFVLIVVLFQGNSSVETQLSPRTAALRAQQSLRIASEKNKVGPAPASLLVLFRETDLAAVAEYRRFRAQVHFTEVR
jgi:hypothetical protein